MLEPKLAARIKEKQQQMLADQLLFPKAKLDVFYKNFQDRFSPDQLSRLDGEDLVEFMHNHSTRDSLVYWLEFKNDDEFTSVFGSIAGGSALKFMVYKTKETQEWATRGIDNPNVPMSIHLDEAIEIARRNREQLIAGTEAVANLPNDASLSDYEQLELTLAEVAPDVSRLGWGHKYFSLMYPDKLDDYHNSMFQRFYLIKLLQTPPADDKDGYGRYAPAWWYVQIAEELDMPLNHLTSILNQISPKPHNYWRVGTHPGDNPKVNYWELMRDGNYIAIGWKELGDLSQFSDGRDVEAHFKVTIPYDNLSVKSRKAREVRRFTNIGDYSEYLSESDIVLAMNGQTVLGIGQVIGGYQYDGELEFPHLRQVEWLDIGEWKLPEQEGLQTTFAPIKKHVENRIAIERRILFSEDEQQVARENQQSIKPVILPRLDGIPAQIDQVLKRKKQVILYGPPGTGKTYWAQYTAKELALRNNFKTTSHMADDSTIKQLERYVHVCTFHPAYGYEDFIEGYRPLSVDGQLVFKNNAGIFKRLCEDADAESDKDFFLIIDEINRGDIPRIFGELITLLENNKRGHSVTLPLSEEGFHVPSNVYVMGTMNTADRSIALLDTALRRRFGFMEFMPDTTLLDEIDIAGIPLGPWLEALNKRIVDNIGRDARNLQVGHAYFMNKGKPVTSFSQFSRIIREDIIPLLEEYCYEDYLTLEKLLGSGLVDSKQQRIHYELIDSGGQDKLVTALLQPSPEISTSIQAIRSSSIEKPDEEDEEDLSEVDS